MLQKICTILFNGDCIEVEYLQTSTMNYFSVFCDDQDLICPYCGEIIKIRSNDNTDNLLDKDENIIHSCQSLLELSKLYKEERKLTDKLNSIKNKINEVKNNVKAIQFEDNIFWKK